MLHIINKDITTIEAPAIIMHGVNCQARMGSGVAKALYEKYPRVKEEYLKIPKEYMELGFTQLVEVKDKLFVANCFTQYFYGYDGRLYANTDAIKTCLDKVVGLCSIHNIKTIYSPKIGCGLGGLDWEDDVKPIFEATQELHPEIEIIICEFW